MNDLKPISEIQEAVFDKSLDGTLARLYRRQDKELGPYRERILKLLERYSEIFDASPEDKAAVFSAPGRTELGGNHTDHQGGKVLTAAVDLDALCCAAPNGTDAVSIYSEGFGMTSISAKDTAVHEEEKGTSAAIVRGVLDGLAAKGCRAGGFNAYVVSDVPGGSGLSSSACFEILVGTVADGLFGGGVTDSEEMAKIGQYAENTYFGKPSGLLDQMGCSIGGIVSVDFADRKRPVCRKVDFDFAAAGHALCIIDTGGDHSGLTDYYSAIPGEMCAAARVFGKPILSEVEESRFLEALPEVRREAGDRALMRALHYYADCRRVEEQVAALEGGDFDRYLQLVRASGDSSFKCLQNVDTHRDPADQPVVLALAAAEQLLGDAGAVRVHGGGFAGTIQAYVPFEKLDGFRTGMDRLFGDGAVRVVYVRPVGGCRII